MSPNPESKWINNSKETPENQNQIKIMENKRGRILLESIAFIEWKAKLQPSD